ncbi:MAG: peptide chain release factor N(5)-glutamine methyltransferase [Pantoea sp.]|uniref:Release factor glutamine methyltransferase n=1 Tax=Pantoea brenneri TaxID=472694 RepID=A0AAX3J670_9GAMM|nr:MULTISPECIES: peptide chain release factor N(5)-glutamine methyltransferase [Pantoea]MBS6035097.1 peptide chain release factor N(5)-glutamine methyltransferase [Pantoea sp.]MDH2125086.1 peptide chain release factor N(5)-glutamine methyltransferase [Pantoea brenneri]VXB65355.1 N5-glutamine methyltransferase, modifies release factors RF-1 and RF-2 [Pantoea brenneri]
MDIRHWLKQAIAILNGGDSPKRDAEILLSFVTGKSRSWLIAFDETLLSDQQLSQLDALLSRRTRGEPVAHLVGEREFWSLPLRVTDATLIPRPDTELLVEQALAHLPVSAATILDLGTGTGAIALALASERPDCQVIGVDRIAEVVELARSNAQQLNLPNARFALSHWFQQLTPQRFDIIVSNPPYIDASDHHLEQGDVRFEPRSALVAADAGLADLRTLIEQAPDWLQPGGWLLLEHGWQQDQAVRDMMRQHGYRAVETVNDYGGNPRVTLGQSST